MQTKGHAAYQDLPYVPVQKGMYAGRSRSRPWKARTPRDLTPEEAKLILQTMAGMPPVDERGGAKCLHSIPSRGAWQAYLSCASQEGLGLAQAAKLGSNLWGPGNDYAFRHRLPYTEQLIAALLTGSGNLGRWINQQNPTKQSGELNGIYGKNRIPLATMIPDQGRRDELFGFSGKGPKLTLEPVIEYTGALPLTQYQAFIRKYDIPVDYARMLSHWNGRLSRESAEAIAHGLLADVEKLPASVNAAVNKVPRKVGREFLLRFFPHLFALMERMSKSESEALSTSVPPSQASQPSSPLSPPSSPAFPIHNFPQSFPSLNFPQSSPYSPSPSTSSDPLSPPWEG